MRDLIQGTDEWHQARLGKVTASRVADVVAKTKSGWAASRANYEAQLIAERLTGHPTENFTNAAMEWGTATEAEARAAYSFLTDRDVEEVGFVTHPTIAESGASPDGMVGEEGMVEIKCPNTATHINTLLTGKIDGKYQTQMQWQMACTGRFWCDFVSYDPRMPERHRLFIQRVDRDQERIEELQEAVIQFLADMAAKIERLEAL